ILNANEIAAEIAAAIQGGLSTSASPILYDSVNINPSAVVAGTGVNQTLFAANTARRGLILKNASGLNRIYYNFGADATANSLFVEPGETLEMQAHERDLRAFNIFCTSGTPLRAAEIVAV
ncbi:MAG TPA: hypothetical protein VLF16_04500, partial [Pseudomonas sp.]|nr:hypothetical protein [Pseudomonas sp.]